MADGVDHIDIYADVGEEFNQVAASAAGAGPRAWRGRGAGPRVCEGEAGFAAPSETAAVAAAAIVDCGAAPGPRGSRPARRAAPGPAFVPALAGGLLVGPRLEQAAALPPSPPPLRLAHNGP